MPAGGRIVEIGSYHAKSTIVLATAAGDTVEVVAIDPHAGTDRAPGEWTSGAAAGVSDHEHFEQNLAAAGVRHRVQHVREFSHAAHSAVTGDIDLLYVDGAHRYKPASADITGWGVRVRPGGLMLIHDIGNSFFATMAVWRHLSWSTHWRYEGRAASMVAFRRQEIGRRGVPGNLWRQRDLLARFAQKMAVKALRTARLGRFTGLVGHRPGEGLY